MKRMSVVKRTMAKSKEGGEKKTKKSKQGLKKKQTKMVECMARRRRAVARMIDYRIKHSPTINLQNIILGKLDEQFKKSIAQEKQLPEETSSNVDAIGDHLESGGKEEASEINEDGRRKKKKKRLDWQSVHNFFMLAFNLGARNITTLRLTGLEACVILQMVEEIKVDIEQTQDDMDDDTYLVRLYEWLQRIEKCDLQVYSQLVLSAPLNQIALMYLDPMNTRESLLNSNVGGTEDGDGRELQQLQMVGKKVREAEGSRDIQQHAMSSIPVDLPIAYSSYAFSSLDEKEMSGSGVSRSREKLYCDSRTDSTRSAYSRDGFYPINDSPVQLSMGDVQQSASTSTYLYNDTPSQQLPSAVPAQLLQTTDDDDYVITSL